MSQARDPDVTACDLTSRHVICKGEKYAMSGIGNVESKIERNGELACLIAESVVT